MGLKPKGLRKSRAGSHTDLNSFGERWWDIYSATKFEVQADHGWGGRVIQWYASRCPDHFAKLRILRTIVSLGCGEYIRFRSLSGLRFRLPSGESHALLLLRRRGYEVASLIKCDELLPKNGVFVDVGANFGLYSCLLSADTHRTVIAIEPYPPNLRPLQFHTEINQLINVTIAAVAIGNCAGTIHVGLDDPHNPGLARHLPGHPSAVEVPQRTLESVLQERDIQRVDLVKIDVEGAELSVLQGIDFSGPRRPKNIVLEHYSDRDPKSEVFLHLWNLGYKAFDVLGNPISDPAVAVLVDHNVLFTDASCSI